MNDLPSALSAAFTLLLHGDAALGEIVALSLRVSLSAVLIATVIGMPLGPRARCIASRGVNRWSYC